RSGRLRGARAFAAVALRVVPLRPRPPPHYHPLAALAVAGLLAHEWPRRQGLWPGWLLLLAGLANILAGLLDAIGLGAALEFGLATFAALALAAIAVAAARRRMPAPVPVPAAAAPPEAAARSLPSQLRPDRYWAISTASL